MLTTELAAPTTEAITRAGEIIRAGGLVGFPTETVYGLGANAFDPAAVKSIFAAKGRPSDNPLISHISEIEEIYALISGEMPENARRLADAFWPGPMTLIFDRNPLVPDAVTAGLDSVAVRFPSNPVARKLIRASGVPIAAPSANKSGRPSPTTAMHVMEDMMGLIPMIIDGGPCEVGLESTVIDIRSGAARILRPGGVTPEMVERALGHVEIDRGVLNKIESGEAVRSPGMKYKHYAPKGQITIVTGEAARDKICALYDETDGDAIIAFSQSDYGTRRVYRLRDAAGELFDCLRKLDTDGMKTIYSEDMPARGIGLAVMNRLARAAGFKII